jgi:glycerophosphoryl diester phosphodiesterase
MFLHKRRVMVFSVACVLFLPADVLVASNRIGQVAEKPAPALVRASRWPRKVRADRALKTRLGTALFMLAGPQHPEPHAVPTPTRLPQFFAHRGGHSGPENTLPTFQKAWELGFGLEADLHVTQDGFVVVSHDPSGLRMANVDALIEQHTLAEVRTWDVGWGWRTAEGQRPYRNQGLVMPTLDEVLHAFPKAEWSFDVKAGQPSIVSAVIDALRARNMEQQTILASFSTRTALEIRARGFQGRTSLGLKELYTTFLPPLFRLLPMRGDIASLPLEHNGTFYGTQTVIDRCHRCDLQVHFWGVNDIDQARRLIDLGADIIETDEPQALAPLLH